jgi:sugar lactone lactonase YvrE
MLEIDLHALPGRRILAEGLSYPKSPCWHDGRLLFVDKNSLSAVTGEGDVSVLATLPTEVCLGLAPAPNGTVYVSGAFSREIYAVTSGVPTVFADLSDTVDNIINVLIRLPSGTLVVGEMGFNPELGQRPKPGGLLAIDAKGEAKRFGPPMNFPTGLALHQDGTLIVSADGGTSIRRIKVGSADRFEGHETHPILADPPAKASGICIDDGGRIWYGDSGGSAACRLDDKGRPVIRVRTEHPLVISTTIAEFDSKTWLIICETASRPSSAADEPLTGRISAVPIDEILTHSRTP